MLLCCVIDSGLSTSLLLLATLIIMFYIYILHYSPSFVEIEEGLAARFRDPQIIDKQTVDGLIRNR